MIVVYAEDLAKTYWLKNVISLAEIAYYNETGKITITAPADELNIAALRVGNLVYDTDRKLLFLLMHTKVDTNNLQITADGKSAECILNRRVSAEDITITNIEKGVYDAINRNLRGLDIIQTAPVKGLSEEFKAESQDESGGSSEDVNEASVRGDQLLDAITPFLENGDLGRRIIWDAQGKKITFEIYKGVDRTEGIHRVVFSTEQGTCRDLVIDTDDSTFYNCAAAAWEWDGGPWMNYVGKHWNASDRELWVDTGVSGSGSGEEFARKKGEAVAKAAEKLSEYVNRQSFTATIPAGDLGRRYELGDIVTCASVKYGVNFNARITSLKYTLDANQEKTEIVLGKPVLTVIEEVKMLVN